MTHFSFFRNNIKFKCHCASQIKEHLILTAYKQTKAAAKLNEFAAALRDFRKILQNETKGRSPLARKWWYAEWCVSFVT